jgi:cytochrome oxidase Cu insertion factor (SCO1/SenC/PrrC family)
MPGMSPGLNVTDPAVVSAFRSALIHQGLLALTVFALLAVAWLILSWRAGRAGLDLAGASGPTGASGRTEPAGRLVLAVGFGNLWLFDGILQIQPKMALGLPSLVIEPTAQSSPHWVQALVNWAGTTWSYHPVQAAAATVWIQVGLGLWLLTAPRGLLSRLAGLAGVGWGLVVWVFGESFGGIFAPGQSWLTGAPGAALVYVVAGALIALPDRAWQSRRLGRLMLAGLGVFLIGMAMLQAWPGRGFWQGVSHGQLGSLAGMAESMALTPQPGFLETWLGSFASLDVAHGFAVNLFFVLGLAITGVVFASGRPRLIRPVLIAFSVLSLVVWVLLQDLAFLGGLGTDPGSMIPFILLASAGYLALTRPGVAAAPAKSAAPAESAEQAVGGERFRRRISSRVVVASAWSVAALGAVGLIMLGAVPMAVAQASPNADPILAKAIAGPAGPADYPAPGFALTDQRGQAVTLAAMRGKVVVLAFADPAGPAGCPPIGREFRQADELLGASARLVDFVGIGTGRPAAFGEVLDQAPGWRYLTGTRAQLGRVWRDYGVRSRAGSAVVFVIDSSGHVRRRYQLGIGPGSAATSSSFAVLFASGVRAALVGGR